MCVCVCVYKLSVTDTNGFSSRIHRYRLGQELGGVSHTREVAPALAYIYMYLYIYVYVYVCVYKLSVTDEDDDWLPTNGFSSRIRRYRLGQELGGVTHTREVAPALAYIYVYVSIYIYVYMHICMCVYKNCR